MAKSKPQGEVSIGKFDILATYVYARGLIDGLTDSTVAVTAVVIKKKKTTITAESFDRQVTH